ncbi:hypothetical protein NUW54_g13805 [Trametes sanguinea]|uniref:Uncharacterized protein n=1 Tax=Trametes sanguinea TaxID=158606 RepID=A0ACC1MJJ5_9APHY|nr:hypothetical protein NUW54_g13805 [Trametes sanguinea]
MGSTTTEREETSALSGTMMEGDGEDGLWMHEQRGMWREKGQRLARRLSGLALAGRGRTDGHFGRKVALAIDGLPSNSAGAVAVVYARVDWLGVRPAVRKRQEREKPLIAGGMTPLTGRRRRSPRRALLAVLLARLPKVLVRHSHSQQSLHLSLFLLLRPGSLPPSREWSEASSSASPSSALSPPAAPRRDISPLRLKRSSSRARVSHSFRRPTLALSFVPQRQHASLRSPVYRSRPQPSEPLPPRHALAVREPPANASELRCAASHHRLRTLYAIRRDPYVHSTHCTLRQARLSPTPIFKPFLHIRARANVPAGNARHARHRPERCLSSKPYPHITPSTSPILSYFLSQSPKSPPSATFPFRRGMAPPVYEDDEAYEAEKPAPRHGRSASTAWPTTDRFPRLSDGGPVELAWPARSGCRLPSSSLLGREHD